MPPLTVNIPPIERIFPIWSEDQTVINTLTLQSNANITIVTKVHPSPWIDLANLNFDKVLAGDFTVDIFQHMVKREKISEKWTHVTKEDGRQDKELTRREDSLVGLSGMQKRFLDEEVLEIQSGKEQEKLMRNWGQ